MRSFLSKKFPNILGYTLHPNRYFTEMSRWVPLTVVGQYQ